MSKPRDAQQRLPNKALRRFDSSHESLHISASTSSSHPNDLQQDCGFAPDALKAVPGPGEYNVDRANSSSTHKNRAGSSTPTSSFLCTRTPLNVGTNLETPAPGTYELLRAQQTHVDKSGNVLKDPFFRSRTKRNASFIATSDVPGPGEYDVDRGVATANSFGSGGSRGSGTSGRPGQQRRAGGGHHAKEEEEATPGEYTRTSQTSAILLKACFYCLKRYVPRHTESRTRVVPVLLLFPPR